MARARSDSLWQRTKHFAKDDPSVRSGLLDDPRSDHRGGDVGGAANHRLLADDRRELLRAVDAVLKRQDGGFGPSIGPTSGSAVALS